MTDVAVIGAGPAGLMAAEVLAQGGASVTVYDAMPSAGRKFLMAGRGGLNLTHSEPQETDFGTTIAHGFLTMSLLSVMSYEVMPAVAGATMGVNYGFDKLRFISPVRSGKRVRGRFVLAEAKLRKPKEFQTRTNVTVEIEGEDKPALVAEWLGLTYFA